MRRTAPWVAALFLAMIAWPAAAGEPVLVAVEEDSGDFYAVSTSDASLNLIGNGGVTGLGSLEFNSHDGFFYGFTGGDAPTLYRFDIASSLDSVVAEAIGPLGLFAFEGGLAFGPDGTAFAVNGGVTVPSLVTLNLSTGQASVVGAMDGRHDLAGLAWRSDGMLIGLDSTDNALLAVNPSNATSTLIDDVAATIGGVGGMTLLGDVGYFVTGGPLAGPKGQSPGSNELFSFDPMTGEQFFVGSFEDVILGSGFSGLSVVPEPATLSLVLCGCAGLLRRWGMANPKPA
jgi:hypothetical protein